MSSVFRGSEEEQQRRVLFCVGVAPAFFEADTSELETIGETIKEAFANLGQFGIEVLGTFDDDQLMVGSSPSYPWTCYILANAPSDFEAITTVTDIVRATKLGDVRLWKYLKIEARVGRPLFFANA